MLFDLLKKQSTGGGGVMDISQHFTTCNVNFYSYLIGHMEIYLWWKNV